MELETHLARFSELDTATLYAILRLRMDVFVVEQTCSYPDLDGRDNEPETEHFWVTAGSRLVAYLRIVAEPDGTPRIGRVCTAADARGHGLAGHLLTSALEHIGARESTLHAQAHLVDYYARFGYERSGVGYVEDGIPHVPMRRAAGVSGATRSGTIAHVES